MKKTIFTIIILLFMATNINAQTCLNTTTKPSTPTERFIDNGNGTVTDSCTGLMWKKCLEGVNGSDCKTGNTKSFTWQEALVWADTVNKNGGFAGYTNWRIPNIKELSSIVERQCYYPSINYNVFPNWLSYASVWSSSSSKFQNEAYDINFGYGHVNAHRKDVYFSVCLVRDAN